MGVKSMTYERRIEISSYFRNKNFMTPTVVRYGETEHLIYELSLGKGFSQNTIYGVTVLTKKVKKQNLGNAYIADMKQKNTFLH